jgi:hypothetical protein
MISWFFATRNAFYVAILRQRNSNVQSSPLHSIFLSGNVMSNRNRPFARPKKRRSGFTQPLRVESLEDRRLLATFTVTNLADSGTGSLREAVSFANANSGADEIVFSVQGSIGLTSGELEVTDSLTIAGPGQDELTIDAQHESRLIHFNAPTGDLSLSGLRLVNGQTTDDAIAFNDTSQNGGGIHFASSGVLSLTDSSVRNSRTLGSQVDGGGIFIESGDLALIDSSVSDNFSLLGKGGGIHSGTGSITLTDSSVSRNFATGRAGTGGGIYSYADSISLHNSNVLSNRANGNGGGIALGNGSLAATGSSLIAGNTSDAYGGGISIGFGRGPAAPNSVTLDSSFIYRNRSEIGGGGIAARRADITLIQSSVSDNRSARDGGGIQINRGSVTLNRAELNQNNGRGIFANQTRIDIVDSTIDGNDGGGIFARAGGVNISGSTLSNNLSRDPGAAFWSIESELNLANSTVSGNVSFEDGGGLSGSGEFLIESSTIFDNTAIVTGGGIDAFRSVTIRNSIIAGNSDDGTAPDIFSSGLTTASHSLIGNNAGSGLDAAPIGSPDASENLIGTSAAPIDPSLSELADNGGLTLTHALLPGSPAIDAGSNELAIDQDGAPQLTDQRGSARFVDGNGSGIATIDIGAFEYNLSGNASLTPAVTRDEGGVLVRPDLLNTYAITFNARVNIDTNDLTIQNETLGGTVVDTTGLSFNYSPANQTATWDFANLTLDPGFYSFELSDNITSSSGGASLDGDFDGVAGGNFVETVYVALPGDANLDGQVDVLNDAFALVGNLGTTGGASWAQGDFNGDGTVDVLNDAFALVGQLGQSVIPSATSASSSKRVTDTSTQLAAEPEKQAVLLDDESTSLFTLQEKDERQPTASSSSAAKLALVGSQAIDNAFAADSLLDDGLF